MCQTCDGARKRNRTEQKQEEKHASAHTDGKNTNEIPDPGKHPFYDTKNKETAGFKVSGTIAKSRLV